MTDPAESSSIKAPQITQGAIALVGGNDAL